jgi:hypothetical protein
MESAGRRADFMSSVHDASVWDESHRAISPREARLSNHDDQYQYICNTQGRVERRLRRRETGRT